jgi:hypothetical protein
MDVFLVFLYFAVLRRYRPRVRIIPCPRSKQNVTHVHNFRSNSGFEEVEADGDVQS